MPILRDVIARRQTPVGDKDNDFQTKPPCFHTRISGVRVTRMKNGALFCHTNLHASFCRADIINRYGYWKNDWKNAYFWVCHIF